MIVVRMVKQGVIGLPVALLLAALVWAPPAPADPAAWWHINSSTVPTSLQRGVAKSEVQEIVTTPGELAGVKATGFELSVGGKEVGLFLTEPLAAGLGFPALTAANVQEALETVYGKGNVEVTGGTKVSPGAVSPLVVKSIAADAGETVPQLEVFGVGVGSATGKIATEGKFSGLIVALATNLGYASVKGSHVPLHFADKLPHGLRAVSIAATLNDSNDPFKLECSVESLTCTVPYDVRPYEIIEVQIGVVVEEGASSGELNQLSISGGETLSALSRLPVKIGSEPPSFGVSEYEMTPEEEDGGTDTQAGSHPFQLTTNITLNQKVQREHTATGIWEALPVSPVKNLDFKLPPGLIGNPTPIPQCTLVQFLTNDGENGTDCAPDTAIGVALVNANVVGFLGKVVFPVPVFNLEPAIGEPARFGFDVVQGDAPVILDTSVRTGGDYGITVKVHNITETAAFLSSLVTFWGVPGDARHDTDRGWGCLFKNLDIPASTPCSPEEAVHPPPFLSLPTACTGPLPNSVEAETWTQEGLESSLPSDPMPAMDGCNRLPFNPSVIVTPDGRAGSTPTGLNVDDHVSQLSTLAPDGLAESAIKGLTVTLPEGVAINPAGADGLLSCSMEEIGLQSAEPPTCPEASKVGTVRIKTPLLPNALEGEVYLAEQSANPFGSLFGLYVYAQDPISGLSAKAAGELVPDSATGQLETHFEADPLFVNDPRYATTPTAQFLPELPFEDLELHFFGGDRAPLTTPASCGTYVTKTKFSPWSGSAPTESSSAFQVVSGPNGSPCHAPLPFAPTLTAGTTSIQAGGFSPFTMTMSREDGMQNLRSIELHLPPGMSGTLSTVKLCGEEQADAGTCPPDTEIGETIVSVGVGGDPFSVKGGKVYITGPYKGAPFGLSIVNPAKAGPFDLGKVIVRAKVDVNPITTALTITTDTEGPYKLPTILDGIPLQIRHVNVNINRQNFTFNPTNCSPQALTGSLGSTEGATSPVSVPFQITNCAVLAFKPQLTGSTSGKFSRVDGTSLNVKLGYPAGPYDANIARVKVELPKGLPSRLATLQKACTAAVFEANPANCPAASVIGHATATTPILPVPLSGPAYFVSHGGEAFPSLIVVLQGYGVTVQLVGTTFISKAGITSSTFKTVPDAPVGTFELNLPAGPYSALTGLGNLCKAKTLSMPTEFVGQNGAEIHTTTKIAVTGCPKAKQKVKKAKEKKSRHKSKPKRGRRKR
jgi:hypothetical protein